MIRTPTKGSLPPHATMTVAISPPMKRGEVPIVFSPSGGNAVEIIEIRPTYATLQNKTGVDVLFAFSPVPAGLVDAAREVRSIPTFLDFLKRKLLAP